MKPADTPLHETVRRLTNLLDTVDCTTVMSWERQLNDLREELWRVDWVAMDHLKRVYTSAATTRDTIRLLPDLMATMREYAVAIGLTTELAQLLWMLDPDVHDTYHWPPYHPLYQASRVVGPGDSQYPRPDILVLCKNSGDFRVEQCKVAFPLTPQLVMCRLQELAHEMEAGGYTLIDVVRDDQSALLRRKANAETGYYMPSPNASTLTTAELLQRLRQRRANGQEIKPAWRLIYD